jgi:hypothetical protein
MDRGRAAQVRASAPRGLHPPYAAWWTLNPIRIEAVAEDLRVLPRQRDLDVGIVVISGV